jgi:hypothetical protein
MPAMQLIAVAGMMCSLLIVSDESVVEMMRSSAQGWRQR